MTYEIKTTDGSTAQLWSDDTYTLHFGEGFIDQVESTPDALADAIDPDCLSAFAAGRLGDGNDASKAAEALRCLRQRDPVHFDFLYPSMASLYELID